MQNGEFDEVTFDTKPKGNQTTMMPISQGMQVDNFELPLDLKSN